MDALPYLLAAQALIAAVTILWVRRYLKRLADEDGAVAAARRDVAALIAELDATTDRNLTIVEDKLGELKAALAETDKRLALLSRERPAQAGGVAAGAATVLPDRAAGYGPPPRPPERRVRLLGRRPRGGYEARSRGEALGRRL